MENGDCQVVVVKFPMGVIQGCKVCGEVLVRGNFLIGIHVYEDGSDFKYFLGSAPQEHCGEEKKFLRCFETESEAETERLSVLSHIAEKGTTEGLTLLKIIDKKLN